MLIGALRHVLSSQIHRRFNRGAPPRPRSAGSSGCPTPGCVERLQFHRHDGGGVPMCYVITAAGLQRARGRASPRSARPSAPREPGVPRSADGVAATRARCARRATRCTSPAGCWRSPRSWPRRRRAARRPRGGAVAAQQRSTGDGRVALGPAICACRRPHAARLPAHRRRRHAHRGGALRDDPPRRDRRGRLRGPLSGARRPAAEGRDRRARRPAGDGRAAAKLERYDHFLAGWSVHTRRYGTARGCRAARRVRLPRPRACSRVRTGAPMRVLALPRIRRRVPVRLGVPRRERIVFAAERDMHEGCAAPIGVPAAARRPCRRRPRRPRARSRRRARARELPVSARP